MKQNTVFTKNAFFLIRQFVNQFILQTELQNIIITDTTNQSSASAWQYDVAAAYGLNGWNPTNSVWGLNLSHAIWANLCTPLDVQGISLDDAVKLYPNPTASSVTVEFEGQPGRYDLDVYNVLSIFLIGS